MSIVSLREILQDANLNQYAVGMFDVHNMEMTHAAIMAAQQENSPVIIALAEVHINDTNLKDLANIMVHAANNASVPVAVHYDHGVQFQYLIQVMKLGFSSIMYDGSTLPLKQNMTRTAEIAKIAHAMGVSLEAEIGHVGCCEDGKEDGYGMIYTEPNEAKEFVEHTGVDALAVSIGTVHGNYIQAPMLDIDRLKTIRQAVGVPLVLHGGSGLSDKDFKRCIAGGISKINIYTEVVQAAIHSIQNDISTSRVSVGYADLMEKSVEEMCMVIAGKMRLFGSSGMA